MRGSTAATRLLATVLVALSALGATYAGGDERLTRAQYQARAGKQCEKLLDASEELAKAQAPGATGKRVTRYLHKASDRLGDLVEGFDGLTPPKKLEADHDELVDVLDGYAEGLDTLADRVKRGQTMRAALEDNQDLVARLNGIAQRSTALVTELGLSRCLLPG